MSLKKLTISGLLLLTAAPLILFAQQKNEKAYSDLHRPQIHFSPKLHWMNDPNGMVYYKGVYHLFFQYYPGATVWGPMHWGHAESPDMIHWKQMPVALYPDSLGFIFSGSAVADVHNTSGFAKNGKTPLVAIFTHHDPKGEKQGSATYQSESLAYSLDDGKTWTKYANNPVVKNPGIKDFRDPKVMWYEPEHEWVMTLATLDRVTFFSSPNLKDWHKESEFGKTDGAHDGVWECPDLFPLRLDGKTYWVLLVSTNPGGPNGGSGTQYFIGDFDGKEFKAFNQTIHWVDYGPDDYAGVTWFNTGGRRIFLGWMSNWLYGTSVPTEKWRSAMTIPRELALKQINGKIFLTSHPVKELADITGNVITIAAGAQNRDLFKATGGYPKQYTLKFDANSIDDYAVEFSNDDAEKLIVGYDKKSNRYYIDRSQSGNTGFSKEFAKTYFSPRLTASPNSSVELVVDAASLELFADDGLTIMTSIFFPKKPYNHLLVNDRSKVIKHVQISTLKGIW